VVIIKAKGASWKAGFMKTVEDCRGRKRLREAGIVKEVEDHQRRREGLEGIHGS
jgi:hypothetical protein